jgi:hypothetical protein
MSTTYNKNKENNLFLIKNEDIFDLIQQRVSADHSGATVFVPHVCNNIDQFGAGFASSVASHYPSVKADYHMLGKNFLKNNLGHSQFLKVYEEPKYKHKIYFINMIAQNGIRSASNPRPLNYAALVRCMINVSYFINNNTGHTNNTEHIEIHAPKFGSGLAGGNWNFISDLITDIWSKYPVFIYDFSHNKFHKK